jgi:hypothetical protein
MCLGRGADIDIAHYMCYCLFKQQVHGECKMKAIDFLNKQRRAALSLSETEQIDVQRENYVFCAQLCQELMSIINVDVILNEAQAQFVGLTVSSVGYRFIPGQDVKYKEVPTVCLFLLMHLATYINSCR